MLKRNPQGEPKPSDFEMVTEEVPPIEDGQMLLRTRWLTLDPYMRSGPMNKEENISDFSDSEKSDMFHDTAERVYAIGDAR